jgi:hypothetical protein
MEIGDFQEKTDALLTKVLIETRTEMLRLYKCGGIDPEDYENDYLLPMIIMCVALQNISNSYSPTTRSEKRKVKNLLHF